MENEDIIESDKLFEVTEFLIEKAEHWRQHQKPQDSKKVKHGNLPLFLGPTTIYPIRDKQFVTRYPIGLDNLLDIILPQAQKKHPNLFGTGDPEDIIEALFRVDSHNFREDKDAYEQYHLHSQSLWITDFNTKKVLKLDLFRNRYIKDEKDFQGGLLHTFKHFTDKNIPLSALKKGTTQLPIDFISKIIEVWFFGEYVDNKENKHVFCTIGDDKYEFRFYFDPSTNIYLLNTAFKNSDLKEEQISVIM